MLGVSTGRRISELLSLRHLLSGSFRFLGGELKETADETLFLELALRGYDRSRLCDEDLQNDTLEILKIS